MDNEYIIPSNSTYDVKHIKINNCKPRKQKNIILDLDETLVSSMPIEEVNLSSPKTKKFNYINIENEYISFLRPNLQEFLTKIFNDFNVSIWSAGSQSYVLYIVENVILKNHPERCIDYIMFSYHCKLSKKLYKNTKDLSMLWNTFHLQGYNKDNTMIIDDFKEDVYKNNPNNCFLAEPFDYKSKHSHKDDFLNKLYPILNKFKNN